MKRSLNVFCLALIVCLAAALPAAAANTVTLTDNVITISAIDSDWTWTDTLSRMTAGVKVVLVRFNPGAANDRLVIKQGTAAGAELVNLLATDTEARLQYLFGATVKPMLDYSDCTLSSGAKVTIVLEK